MSVQTLETRVNIEWDDGSVIIFSFPAQDGSTVICGFPHIVPAWQSQTGTQTQVSATVQSIQTAQMQISADPATWVETVKFGARTDKIKIVYEDSTNTNYTDVNGTGYKLQQLFSLAG